MDVVCGLVSREVFQWTFGRDRRDYNLHAWQASVGGSHGTGRVDDWLISIWHGEIDAI